MHRWPNIGRVSKTVTISIFFFFPFFICMDVYVWSCECVVFIFNRDLVAELPFILMHPKPEEEEPNPILTDRSPGKHHSAGQRSDDANENASSQVTTGNLIQLDGLVFGSICLNCLNIIAVVLYNFTYQIIKFQWYRLQMCFYSSSSFCLSCIQRRWFQGWWYHIRGFCSSTTQRWWNGGLK